MASNNFPEVFDGAPVGAVWWFNPIAEAVTALQSVVSAAPVWATKNVDETVNNSSALQNDNDLSLSLASNASYVLTCHLIQNSGATPAFKLDLPLPGGATWWPGSFICGASLATAQLGVMGTPAITGISGTGSDSFVDFHARLDTTSSGTLTLRWAQTTANASNTIVRAGSYLMAQRTA